MGKPRLPYTLEGPLRTERLLLRAMTPADVEDVYAYQSLEEVCRYLPFGPRSREEVAEKVAEFSAASTLAADRDYWQLAIERASHPGRVVGDLYFSIRSVEHASAAIGWTLHPDFTGHGYITESAGAVLEVAFARLGLHRVFAELDPRNVPSAAVCRRLGMRSEAHFVQDTWFKGAWADTAVYGLLDREWTDR